MNDVIDALSPACDYGFAASHRLQVHTSQPFVSTGQNKYRAAAHGLGHLGTTSSPQKMHLIADPEIFGQSDKTFSICSISNDQTRQIWISIFQPAEGSEYKIVSLSG